MVFTATGLDEALGRSAQENAVTVSSYRKAVRHSVWDMLSEGDITAVGGGTLSQQ